MTLMEFAMLLQSVCENTSHFESEGDDLPRVVYAETGRTYECYDNIPKVGYYNVDVHFFTETEFDPMFEQLESLFAGNGIPFSLEKIEYGSVKMRDSSINGVIYYLFKCIV